MNHFQGHFNFFRKFAEMFASQGAPPVSRTPASGCHRYQQHQRYWWQNFAAGIVDTGFKFATGGVGDTGDAPCLDL
jgi:hypothetical protein